MKCYNHPEVDAVGICKTCNKGICHSCLTDVGNGIACTATCVDEVKEVNSFIERNKNIYKKASKTNSKYGYFLSALGLLALLFNKQSEANDTYIFVFGIMTITVGIFSFFISYTQKNK